MTAVVIGLGFRAAASIDSLRDACRAALASVPSSIDVTALATAVDKAAFPPLDRLGGELALPVIAVSLEALALQPAAVRPRAPSRYGGRSLSEAAALAVAGPNARLLAPRTPSTDRRATAAIAIQTSP